jgi:signal peptidase I, bacterial type
MKEFKWKSIFEYIKLIVLTLIITNIILYIISPSKVSGESMEPKFSNGDYVLLFKTPYIFSDPSYNDLVVINYNPSSPHTKYIVKRVIGLPGDVLEFKDNLLYRNGELLEELYLKEEMMDLPDRIINIPEGKLFVLGDNRNKSIDSRHFGYIDINKHIVGRVLFKLF